MRNVVCKSFVSVLAVSGALAAVFVCNTANAAKADKGKKNEEKAREHYVVVDAPSGGSTSYTGQLKKTVKAGRRAYGTLRTDGSVTIRPSAIIHNSDEGPTEICVVGTVMKLDQLPINDVLSIALSSKSADKDLPEMESLIQRTLAINPQVVAARAELQRAQAGFQRIQLEVTRNVIQLRARWEVTRRNVKRLEEKVSKDKDNAELARAYVEARAELAQIESELPLLADSGTTYTVYTSNNCKGGGVCIACPSSSSRTLIAHGSSCLAPNKSSKESKKPNEFDKPITLAFKATEMKDVSEYLQEISKVPFVIDCESAIAQGGIVVTINLKDIPLKDALQAIEDTTWPVKFVERSYGVLVTDEDNAIQRFGRKPEGSPHNSRAFIFNAGPGR